MEKIFCESLEEILEVLEVLEVCLCISVLLLTLTLKKKKSESLKLMRVIEYSRTRGEKSSPSRFFPCTRKREKFSKSCFPPYISQRRG